MTESEKASTDRDETGALEAATVVVGLLAMAAIVLALVGLVMVFSANSRLTRLEHRLDSRDGIEPRPSTSLDRSGTRPTRGPSIEIIVDNPNNETVEVTPLSDYTRVTCTPLTDINATSCVLVPPLETRRYAVDTITGPAPEIQIFRFQIRRGSSEAAVRGTDGRCTDTLFATHVFRVDNGYGLTSLPLGGAAFVAVYQNECSLTIDADAMERGDRVFDRREYVSSRRLEVTMEQIRRRQAEIDQSLRNLNLPTQHASP